LARLLGCLALERRCVEGGKMGRELVQREQVRHWTSTTHHTTRFARLDCVSGQVSARHCGLARRKRAAYAILAPIDAQVATQKFVRRQHAGLHCLGAVRARHLAQRTQGLVVCRALATLYPRFTLLARLKLGKLARLLQVLVDDAIVCAQRADPLAALIGKWAANRQVGNLGG
jgi:hypothetical protein